MSFKGLLALPGGGDAPQGASDRGVRADIYTAAGARIDAGPAPAALSLKYSMALQSIGTFSLTVPAEDAQAAALTGGNRVWIYVGGEGLVMRGIIDNVEDDVGNDGTLTKVVSGSTISRELVDANTLGGLQFNDIPLLTAVGTLLSGTSFGTGQVGAPVTNIVLRADWQPVWTVLQALADRTGYSLREDPIGARVDIDAFGTNPLGLIFGNVENLSPALQAANPYFIPVASVRQVAVSADICNRLIPLGQAQGISGARLTLEQSTRVTPYAIHTGTNPDGSSYWYIEDTASQATYGLRVRAPELKREVPLGISDLDFVAAANGLYDNAVTYLQRYKDEQVAYAVSVVGLKHIFNGQQIIRLGNTVRLQYDGIVTDLTGTRRSWKSINTDLYIMGFDRTIEGDNDQWNLVLSTVPREIPNDGNVTASIINRLSALESSPLPFILFGDNQLRIDTSGLQFAGGLYSRQRVYFLDTLTDQPTNALPRVEFGPQGIDGTPAASSDGSIEGGSVALRVNVPAHDGGLLDYAQMQMQAQWDKNQVIAGNIPTAGMKAFSGGNYFELLAQLVIDAHAVTIASGVATIGTALAEIDTEGAAATDDLDTINSLFSGAAGMPTGAILFIHAANDAHEVVVKHGTGNILTATAQDVHLIDSKHFMVLYFNGSNFLELARSHPGGRMKVQNAGYQVYPSATSGVDPASSGGSWTNGAWSQVVASTGEIDLIVGFTYQWLAGPTSGGVTTYEAEIDIGTGGAGSETVVSTMPVEVAAGADGAGTVYFPDVIEVAAGTRIAVRVRNDNATWDWVPGNVKLIYVQKTNLVAL